MASPGFDVSGGGGTTIEAPKARASKPQRRRVGWGLWGVSAPQPTMSRWERRELAQRGPLSQFSAYFRLQNASGSKKNTILLELLPWRELIYSCSVVRKIVILWNLELLEKLQIPLWKSGGDSHHHLRKVVVTSHHRHIQSCAYASELRRSAAV